MNLISVFIDNELIWGVRQSVEGTRFAQLSRTCSMDCLSIVAHVRHHNFTQFEFIFVIFRFLNKFQVQSSDALARSEGVGHALCVEWGKCGMKMEMRHCTTCASCKVALPETPHQKNKTSLI